MYTHSKMEIKKIDSSKSKFIFYGIRERLAWTELETIMGYTTTNISDEDGFESWDVIYDDKGQRNIAEVKIRKRFSTDFGGERWILEKTKYDAAMKSLQGEVAKKLHLNTKFIVFFYDCIAIWDLSKIKLTDFFVESLRASSVDGNDDKRDKEITYLKITDAQVIDYQLDFNKLSYNAATVFKYRYPQNKKDILNIE